MELEETAIKDVKGICGTCARAEGWFSVYSQCPIANPNHTHCPAIDEQLAKPYYVPIVRKTK
ncbi:Uncharacterised protein [uncultured archaeon]|nr:Uncharacterised protein [uncultured archaeon]